MGKGVSGGGNMNCGEFQESLAYIIDTGGNAKQKEHLKECSVCSDLVSDLRYIADQAKLLVPMLEPSSRVWDLPRAGDQAPGDQASGCYQ